MSEISLHVALSNQSHTEPVLSTSILLLRTSFPFLRSFQNKLTERDSIFQRKVKSYARHKTKSKEKKDRRCKDGIF